MILSLSVSGQNEFTSIQLPSRYMDDYWVANDNSGNICIQYYKKPNLHFVIIDEQGNKVREKTHPFRYEPTIFGSNFSKGSFQFYYQPKSKKKEGDMAAVVVGTAGEVKQVRYDLKASRADDFTGHFADDEALYLIISVRGSNVIRVAHLDGGDDPVVGMYTAPQGLEKAFKSQEPFLFVQPLGFKSIYSFQANKKVYFKDGNLYFTFDNREQFKTILWKINLAEQTSEMLNIPQKKLVFGKSSNSFLFGDQLFRFTADQVKIDLSIYDLYGKDSVISLNHTGETLIPFKTGPITFIDEYGTQRSVTQMKNDKLFKTFSNGNPSIFVERLNRNNVKVSMGAFNEMASGLSIGGGFGSFGGSGGVAIGGSKQLTGTKRGSTFIHSYLSLPDLEVSSDDNLLTSNERIFRFLDKNGRKVISSKVYSYSEETIHLAYIDGSEAKLKIVEFSK